MLFGEVDEGENVGPGLGLVEQGGEPGQVASQLNGDLTPLLAGGGRRALSEGGGNRLRRRRSAFSLCRGPLKRLGFSAQDRCSESVDICTTRLSRWVDSGGLVCARSGR